MIIPSIDLMNGNAVQLIGGKEQALNAGDPRPLAQRFGRVGEIAVIDLDAALGKGHNRDVILDLLSIAPCRVGGGIRDLETALFWLDAGASSIILGTKAIPEVLTHLPRDRVMAALDAEHGEVVVKGWTEKTGYKIEDRMAILNEYVSGYLITFVEREGRLGGTNLDQVEALVTAADGARVTIAGGVTTANEIAQLDQLRADAQVGMALYTNKLSLIDAVKAPLDSPNCPLVITDEHGIAIGLETLQDEGLEGIINEGISPYGPVLSLDTAQDRQSMRLQIQVDNSAIGQWGPSRGLAALSRRLLARVQDAPRGSYTHRLLNDAELLRSKLIEEAKELADAVDAEDVIHETADVIYFALVAAARGEIRLSEIGKCLDDRALKITRRPGNAKE
jgi:phosphoribosyl-AMP cyclohydrolase / phosphoribosyl-ATP pyrophosphohydrolase